MWKKKNNRKNNMLIENWMNRPVVGLNNRINDVKNKCQL